MPEAGIAVEQIIDQLVGSIACNVVRLIRLRALGHRAIMAVVLTLAPPRLCKGEASRAKGAGAHSVAELATLPMGNAQLDMVSVLRHVRRKAAITHLRGYSLEAGRAVSVRNPAISPFS